MKAKFCMQLDIHEEETFGKYFKVERRFKDAVDNRILKGLNIEDKRLANVR